MQKEKEVSQKPKTRANGVTSWFCPSVSAHSPTIHPSTRLSIHPYIHCCIATGCPLVDGRQWTVQYCRPLLSGCTASTWS